MPLDLLELSTQVRQMGELLAGRRVDEQRRLRLLDEMLALGEVVANNTRAERPINDTPRSVLSDLTPAFRPGEMLELRARLILSRQTLGGLVGPETFYDTVTHRTVSSIDNSGHNWELLRQRAEAEGLYFEPLAMPDGQATHALLWIACGWKTEDAGRSDGARALRRDSRSLRGTWVAFLRDFQSRPGRR